MSSVDHTWLRMDEPANRMLINGALVLEHEMPIERLRELITERLLPIPRFRQRIVSFAKKRPRWEDDAAFEIERHVFEVTLPGEGGDAELREVVSELVSSGLSEERPLWEFRLIQNYRGGSVLFGRIHHCVGDGMALMLVLLSLADRRASEGRASEGGASEGGSTDGAGDRATEETEAEKLSHANPFRELFTHAKPNFARVRDLAEQVMPEGIRLLLQPTDLLKKAGRGMRWLRHVVSVGTLGKLVFRPSDPKTVFKGALDIPKRAAWSESLAVEDVKTIRLALGGTINDVLLTAMAGGLRRYMVERGHATDKVSFRAAMPVNLRSLDEMAALGNRFGLVFLAIPVGIEDPEARLAELGRVSKKLRLSMEPTVVYGILRLLGVLPHALQRLVVRIFATKATAVMTNVPGPREKLYLAGTRIRDIFFWVPQSGRVGLGISIFSYDGRVRLGVGTDAALVPDPERIVEGFHQEFAEMLRRAQALGALPSTVESATAMRGIEE